MDRISLRAVVQHGIIYIGCSPEICTDHLIPSQLPVALLPNYTGFNEVETMLARSLRCGDATSGIWSSNRVFGLNELK